MGGTTSAVPWFGSFLFSWFLFYGFSLLFNRNKTINGFKKILTALLVQFDPLIEECLELILHFVPICHIDTVTDTGALHIALDESHVPEFLQVLGNGGLGQSNFVHKVTTDTGLDLEEVLQYGNPGGMGKYLTDEGELILVFGKYFGLGQAHIIILSQYYNILIQHKKIFDKNT
jgi:hypothetical protein